MAETERPTYIAKSALVDYLTKNGFTGTAKALVRDCPAHTLLELNTKAGQRAMGMGTAIHAAFDLLDKDNDIYGEVANTFIGTDSAGNTSYNLSGNLSGSAIKYADDNTSISLTGRDSVRSTTRSNIMQALYNPARYFKENPVSENYDTKVTVETVTFVTLPGLAGRVDVRTLTAGQLASATRVIEDKLKALREIAPEYRPARVNKHIAELDKGLRDLVKAVNDADGVNPKDE